MSNILSEALEELFSCAYDNDRDHHQCSLVWRQCRAIVKHIVSLNDEIDLMARDIKEYGKHRDDCKIVKNPENANAKCSCNFDYVKNRRG